MLTVATCQFPVTGDPRINARNILRQLVSARKRGADVAHFCEGALSGYAGVDLPSFEGYDWALLRDCTRRVMRRAGELGLWVVVGSAHPLSGGHRPHNCVWVIDDSGRIHDRYDKRFVAGDASGNRGELAHYTPGDHASVFSVGGVRCGVMICHEYRYPELYRDYRSSGVDLLLHSFHAAGIDTPTLRRMKSQVGEKNFRFNRGTTLPEITMPAAAQAAAASSHLWISCSNSSRPESCWPSFLVRADGVITGRLRRNRSGVLITRVDPAARLYDSTRAWRSRAMRGVLHSGRLVSDPRSTDRRRL